MRSVAKALSVAISDVGCSVSERRSFIYRGTDELGLHSELVQPAMLRASRHATSRKQLRRSIDALNCDQSTGSNGVKNENPWCPDVARWLVPRKPDHRQKIRTINVPVVRHGVLSGPNQLEPTHRGIVANGTSRRRALATKSPCPMPSVAPEFADDRFPARDPSLRDRLGDAGIAPVLPSRTLAIVALRRPRRNGPRDQRERRERLAVS